MQPFKSIIAIAVDKNYLLFNMTLAIVDNYMDLHVHDCGNNIPLAMEMKI
jgi:hypothetical protein